MTRIRKNYLTQHTPNLLRLESIWSIAKLTRGAIISFRYKEKDRWVFVVNPEWKGLLHGIDLNYVTEPLLRLLLGAPSELLEDEFYKRYIADTEVKKTDSYRTYDIKKMINIKIYEYVIK